MFWYIIIFLAITVYLGMMSIVMTQIDLYYTGMENKKKWVYAFAAPIVILVVLVRDYVLRIPTVHNDK